MAQHQFVLGVNAAYHESSACLLKDGVVVAAAEHERFNRVKRAKSAQVETAGSLSWPSIDFCLVRAGTTLADISSIGYSLNPKKRRAKKYGAWSPLPGTPWRVRHC